MISKPGCAADRCITSAQPCACILIPLFGKQMGMTTSRRDFLKTSAWAAGASAVGGLHVTRALALSATGANTQRLATGWEFVPQSLGGVWEAWHSEGIAVWQPVTLPHCFNHYDACDPDRPYYRGQGWYRTKL